MHQVSFIYKTKNKIAGWCV